MVEKKTKRLKACTIRIREERGSKEFSDKWEIDQGAKMNKSSCTKR